MGQPAVLGELLFGMLLGNLALVGLGGLEFLETSPGIEILAQLGVILLLFQVGLESNVGEMLSVGWSSLLVAVLGVIAPFFLGWGVSAWLLPGEETLAHVFIGATLARHQRRHHGARAGRPRQARRPASPRSSSAPR